MVLCTSYQSVVKPSRVRIRFFFSEITGPLWLDLLIARPHFDSPFEFELVKFYCILNTILKGTHPRIIPARFGLIRFRGFRGEDLNVKVYDVQTENGRQVMAKVGHVS